MLTGIMAVMYSALEVLAVLSLIWVVGQVVRFINWDGR